MKWYSKIKINICCRWFGSNSSACSTADRQRVQHIELVLVCFGRLHAAGLRYITTFNCWSCCRLGLVVLHVNFNLIVHRQFGCISHGRTHGDANQVGKRFGLSNWSTIRYTSVRLNDGLFQCKCIHFNTIWFHHVNRPCEKRTNMWLHGITSDFIGLWESNYRSDSPWDYYHTNEAHWAKIWVFDFSTEINYVIESRNCIFQLR